MISRHLHGCVAGACWWAIGLLLVPAGLWGAAGSPAAATARPDAAAPRTHTLFMGTDIAVEQGGKFHRVRDVSGESFVVTVGSRPEFVPMRGAQKGLKIQQSLKLSAASATLDALKVERAYTAANDPRRKFNAMAGAASAASATVDQAAGRIGGAEVAVHYSQASPYAPPEAFAQAEANLGAAQQDLGASTFSSGSDLNSVGASAATLQAELAQELYDAIELTFEISSPKPLSNPYLVVIARYREPDSKPGTARNWIYAQSLKAVDATPRPVRVLQGGFPQGFELQDCHVHLYDRGTEIATNVAPKRVPLTRDEAFEYLMLEHLAQHKGGSAPASPALVELPDDFHVRVSGGQRAQTLYVRVAPTGHAEEVYQDQACREPIADEYLRTVVTGIRFKPALQNGKPVAGTARLQLGELSL